MTPAVGGRHLVPVPDPFARDYLLLALRLDQWIPGLVDGYFGPADLKAAVDQEQLRAPARLAGDATALADRIATEVDDEQRARWLRVQLRALEFQARTLAGEQWAYVDLVAGCLDAVPERPDPGELARLAGDLARLLPGDAPAAARLAEFDERLTVPQDRLGPLIDWLVGVLCERSATVFGVPEGEDLNVSLVRGQPWSAYNWYDGGLRSRVDVNVDLPIRAPDLVPMIAHETFPGHHLEHAWKETELVLGRGWLESSILLINTPECLLSEGLAEVGRTLILSEADEIDLLSEILGRAGLVADGQHRAASHREIAGLAVKIRSQRARLRQADAAAALMLHADGTDREIVRGWLQEVSLAGPERTAKRLEFLEHPLWRTYVFTYTQGRALIDLWLARVEPDERPDRFRRLLVEQLTPSGIAAGQAGRSAVGRDG